mmetsp:Transcript_21775/g.44724  ORF Transcript_21775/g.44724 Transcript_21775/m.44724 type:complete len:1644 (+) Transcript_21775:148-5079(+)
MDLDALLVDDEDDDELSLDGIDLEELLRGNASDSSDENFDESRPLSAYTANIPQRLPDPPTAVVNEELEELLRQIDDDRSSGDDEGGIETRTGPIDEIVADFSDDKSTVHQPVEDPSLRLAIDAGSDHNYCVPEAVMQPTPPAVPPVVPTGVIVHPNVLPPSTPEVASSMVRVAASRTRLQLAEAREQRNLKANLSQALSPLQGKRRGRKTGDKQHALSEIDSDPSPLGAPPVGGGGVVLHSMEAISRTLQKNAAVHFQHSPGLPTALSVHSKFIAIGTDRGLVLLFDHFQDVRQILGSTSDAESDGPVTSVDISPKSDFLVSGFASGKLVLWDILKGTVLKALADAHSAPIAAVRFYHDKEPSAVSVDTRGCVNKVNFTKTMWTSSYGVATECLLDGAAGQVPAMSVTPPWTMGSVEEGRVEPESLNPLHGASFIAISSERSSFVVAVEPLVKVVFKWQRPTSVASGDLDSQACLPCLSWGWSLLKSGDGSKVRAVLARAWGTSVEFLQTTVTSPTDQQLQPAGELATFDICAGVESATPILALEWLGRQSLAYLDSRYVLHVVDTVSLNEMEVLDVSAVQLVFATYLRSSDGSQLSERMDDDEGLVASGGDGDTIKKNAESFQNSFRSCDGRLYCLGHSSLQTVRVQSWTQRIESLVEDGEWLEALALSLDHFEMSVKPLLLVSSSSSSRPQSEQSGAVHPVSQEIAELLLRYLKLAIENAPVLKAAPHRAHGGRSATRSSRIDLVQSHFQMIAGVCLEYCTVIGRLDLLFGTIFNRFAASNQTRVILELLEPYILQGSIAYLDPEVLAAFVEHHQLKGDLSVVERCLVRMDVQMLDFNSIVTLLRRHKLYSALVHVYTVGLDDFVAPLELMLEGALEAVSSQSADSRSVFETVGFKALLFLHSSFEGAGKAPPAQGAVSPERVALLRKELVDFLLLPELTPSSRQRLELLLGQREGGVGAGSYPYLRVLLKLDCQLTLQAFEYVLDSSVEGPSCLPEPLVLFSALCSLLAPALAPEGTPALGAVSWWQPSLDSSTQFLEFTAKYMGAGVVRPPQSIVDAALQHLASGRAGMTTKEAHDLVARTVALLSPASFEKNTLLPLIESAGFSRAALVLHKADVKAGPHHFASAIQCFLMDSETEFRKEVFGFMAFEVEQQALRAQASSKQGHDSSGAQQDVFQAMKSCIMVQLAVLIDLDRVATVRMVGQLFAEDHQRVLTALSDTPRQQYGLLSAMVAATRDADGESFGMTPFPLDGNDLRLYVQLMARFEPSEVYKYLSTHSDYPLEECVKVCRESNIIDAEAYLLERTGDISGALDLILQSIEKSLEALKLKLRSFTKQDLATMGILPQSHVSGNIDHSLTTHANGRTVLLEVAEGQAVQRNLRVAMEVCERSTAEGSDDQALWNYSLDRLLMTKTLLKLGTELPYQRVVLEAVLTEVMQVAWNKMSAYVPLARIVRKMTDEHSEMHLGELRGIIISVLDTSSYESSIYQSSLALVGNDLHGLVDRRRRLKGAGISIRRVRTGNDTVQLGSSRTQVESLETGSTIKSTRGGIADLHSSADDSRASVFLDGKGAAKIAIARAARLERLVRRQRPKVSLQDQRSGANLPALLSTAPGGVPPTEKAPAHRVPGSLPMDAMHNSEF